MPQPDMPIGELYALLRKRGWITTIDFLMVFILVGTIIGQVVTVIFTNIDHRWAIATIAFLITIVELLTWAIILLFRVAYFAVIIQASLDEMPATSARLAVRFLRTGVPAGQAGG